MVSGDEAGLGQVVYNLINNAIMYTGEDKRVMVEQQIEGGSVMLSVIDTGKGIPEAEIPLIWDRYYRASHHRRATVGTGLGLAIVKSILEAHKLPFGVESKPGEGSRFWFTLPLYSDKAC